MIRPLLSVVAALALMGAAPAPRLQVTDLVGEFDKVLDRTASKPPAEQAQAVRQHFARLLPGFYDPKRLGAPEAAYNTRLEAEIVRYRKQNRTKAAAVRQRFNRMIEPAVAHFERTFGPLPTDRPVYLVISLGEFDGATRSLPGLGDVLLFGADAIAEYHGDSDARAFVQHELFHLYHGKRFTGCEQAWCSLWQEGLATHVAASLNPKASDSDLLLTIPEPIRPALAKHRTEAVCAVLQRLDTTDHNGALFSSRRLSPNLPPRFGYLVGAWVAEDLGRTHSLQQLAKLDGPPLRTMIEQSLRRMAPCSAA